MIFAGIGDAEQTVYAVEDQEAAIASANTRRTGSTTGTVQFGWDFTKIVAPWGSDGPPVGTNSPSTTRARQSNTILIGAAALLAAFLLFRR